MTKKLNGTDYVLILITLLLAVITILGLSSFGIDKSFMFVNQYGDSVKIFGNGIYAQDSFFKAPIFIGSDATMLFLVVPLMIFAIIGNINKRTLGSKLFLIGVLATVLYYATSMVFGVTYNMAELLYIALFSSSLFTLITLMIDINLIKLRKSQKWLLPTKGLRMFLIVSGVALFGIWLMDILPSLFNGKSLTLIENYTTEITYAIDMGIISPLMFICLRLLNKKEGLGDVLLAILLTLCTVMGIMLPIQTIVQTLAGIVTPLPVIVIKVGVFVLLAAFAVYFDKKLFDNLENRKA